MHISVYRFASEYMKFQFSRKSFFFFSAKTISWQGPENTAFLIKIHEPIIWRLHGLIQQANIARMFETETTSVSVDPIIQIGYALRHECFPFHFCNCLSEIR